ncbi:MAG: BCCT family transporter [Deltaproteobacteria bacterium]|jgi:choline-glycine betaine transporter|nr:BCCT family transporter [Deltaproteobacteria bacterium]
MSTSKSSSYKTDWFVILLSLIIFGCLFVLGVVSPDKFSSVLTDVVNTLCDNFGWALNISVIACIIVSLYFLLSKKGEVVIGGPEAKPEFTTFIWWAISLCSGMGMGIVFFPPAEIIEYTFRPAVGAALEPGSKAALSWAFEYTYLHWTVTLYAVYVAAGLASAYIIYNLRQPFSVASTLFPVFGAKIYRYRSLIDGLVAFTILGGVAGSFGYGILQVTDGVRQLAGIPANTFSYLVIGIVITFVYTFTAVTGLKKGIKILADNNAKIFIAMLAFVAIFGPTRFSLNIGTETTGNMLSNIFKHLTLTEPFLGHDKWSTWWNWLWYLDFFIFAPTTGLFLARLAKGRTLRQFVMVNLVAPCLFIWAWVTFFGGLAAHAQFLGKLDLWQILQDNGVEAIMLSLFETLPLPTLSKAVMILVIMISFITLANAVTSTVSKMSFTPGPDYTQEDPPGVIQIFWGVLMGAIALLFILNSGFNGARTLKLLMGFPIVALELLVMYGLMKLFITGKFQEAGQIVSPREG